MRFVEMLPRYAEPELRAWAEQLPEGTTPDEAWAACPSARWMAWIVRGQVPTPALAERAVSCARSLALAVADIHDRSFPSRPMRALLLGGTDNVWPAARAAQAEVEIAWTVPAAGWAANTVAAATQAMARATWAGATAQDLLLGLWDAAWTAEMAARGEPQAAMLADAVRQSFPTCPIPVGGVS